VICCSSFVSWILLTCSISLKKFQLLKLFLLIISISDVVTCRPTIIILHCRRRAIVMSCNFFDGRSTKAKQFFHVTCNYGLTGGKFGDIFSGKFQHVGKFHSGGKCKGISMTGGCSNWLSGSSWRMCSFVRKFDGCRRKIRRTGSFELHRVQEKGKQKWLSYTKLGRFW